MGTISNPPKFGPTQPGPQSLADWVNFWRWLTSMWGVAKAAVTAPQSIVLSPPVPAPPSASNATLAALAAVGARPAERTAVSHPPLPPAPAPAQPCSLTATDLLGPKYYPLPAGAVNLPNVGPGAGTYVVGAKLTGGGTNGSITIDAQGRITAISPAT